MDRRKVLGQLGTMLIWVPAARLLAGCGEAIGTVSGEDPDAGPGRLAGGSDDAGQTRSFTSNVTNDHTHTLTASTAALAATGPAGLTRPTSVTQGHSHTLTLTQRDLEQLAAGGTLRVETSLDVGHTHTFELGPP